MNFMTNNLMAAAADQHEVQAAGTTGDPGSRSERRSSGKYRGYTAVQVIATCLIMIKALELRAARPKVLQVAREWKCTICEHRHRKDPRHFATLETIPQKWERLQVDMFTWMHPHTKEKQHVLVMIDEATRFRMTRIASTGRGNKTTWEKIKQNFGRTMVCNFWTPKSHPLRSRRALDVRRGRQILWQQRHRACHHSRGESLADRLS